MKIESLRDLYVEQLQGLYDAELQQIKALPKMAKAASAEDLRVAFEDHLTKTIEHAHRVEIIFEQMGGKARERKCVAMECLVKEASAVIDENIGGALKDAALIAAAQQVEHYEIAGYGCVRTHATVLGEDVAAAFLDQTLEEEEEADRRLNGIAERLHPDIPKGRDQSEGRTVSRRSMSVA
jgi:ferritin-like metal-binding protein YciE